MAPPDPQTLAADRAEALSLVPVSRETQARLDAFVAVLLERQQRMNLIGASTEPKVWTRHVADSLQLLALAPDAKVWVDLGSGAGFPGVVLACALADTPGAVVHLVERSTKKASFLQEAVRLVGLPAEIHAERVEDFVRHAPPRIDVVTARALAPLCELLREAYPLLKRGAQGVFLKGQDVGSELTDAAKCWKIQSRLIPSLTSAAGRILAIDSVRTKP
jgi:16S rRNA (guanine527-N7)-methyltransferase